MQSAKETVGKFLHKSGKHTTELHSHQNAPVTHETVKSTEAEDVTRAVDREVHETHHQTEVQPVYDREVRSTEHHQNVLPVENRHHQYGNETAVKEKLGAIAGAFGNKQHVEETQHVQGDQSEIVGEHHHHHIHHTVQPVIKKETVQPHVVHTTVPVHERVDLESTVHGATVAKPLSMDQFKQQVGVGKTDRNETLEYQGDPLNISKDANVGFAHGNQIVDASHHSNTSTGLSGTSGASHQRTHRTRTGSSSSSSSSSSDVDRAGRGSDYKPSSTTTGKTGTGILGHHNRDQNQTIGSASTTLGSRDHTSNKDHSLLGHHDKTRDTHTTGSSMLGSNTTDSSRKMPGDFVHDSSDRSGTSHIPRTVGHNTHDSLTGTGSNPTGFIDGRSPNDNKTTTDDHDKEKSGGLISGLINKITK